MKKQITLLALSACLASPLAAMAEDEIATAETQITEEADKADYLTRVKEKYNLTDEQIASMRTAGISAPQFAVVGSLAQSSGKTIEDILKMRTEEKMGWGKIAKELGLAPGSIGQSVAEMHRNNSEKTAAMKEMRENRREEKKLMREEKKQARKEARAQKREKKVH